MISTDSEVYKYANQINNLDDYIKFMRVENQQKPILFKRFINLYKSHFINISENSPINLDPLILIVESEKQLNVYPYGRRWENYSIDIDTFIKNNFLEKYKIYKDEQIKMELLAQEYLNKNYLKHNKDYFNHMQKLIKQMGEENIPISVYYKDIIKENFIKFNVNFKIAKISYNEFNKESLQVNYWKDLFLKNTGSDEIEIRFQYVTGIEFGNVFQYCLSNPETFFHINRFSFVNRQNINKDVQQRTYNFQNECDNIPFHQLKETKDVRFNNVWNFKVVHSVEKNVLSLKYTNPDRFWKNSFSFYTRNKKHPLRNFILDMSVTKDENDTKIKYKIELEKRTDVIYTEIMLYNAMTYILKLMQNVKYDHELINSSIKKDIFKIIKNPKSFVNKVLPFSTDQKSVLEFINSVYYVTNKLDGERVILLIDTQLGVFIIFLDGTKKRILNSFTLENNFNINVIFDCELFKNTINIFDIVTVNTLFENRLQMMLDYVPFLKTLFSKIKNYDFDIKEFILIKSMEDIGVFYENVLLSEDLDGIILQPNDTNYKNSIPLKVKPPKLNTLDILVLENQDTFSSSVSISKNINSKLVRKCDFMKYNFNISLFIVEVTCIKNAYYPLKVRFEKTYGNPDPILKSNIRLTEMSIKDIIDGRGIILAKKIINYLKQTILNDNRGTLVDVGSGQGGDIDKWNNFRKIYAIERDDNMIEIFNERKKKSSLNIELIHSDFEDVVIKERIDVMTIFFSVNFICRSEESLKKYVKKIKEINPRKIILLYNDYSDLKRIQSDYLQIKELDEGYIITIDNTFVVNVLEYRFIVNDFIKELGYNYVNKKLDDLNYSNISKFENDFLKSIRHVEFSKENIIPKFSQEFVNEDGDVEEDFDEENAMYFTSSEDESDEDVIIEYEVELEAVETNPVINIYNLDTTNINESDLIKFWPVPSEYTALFMKDNELLFKRYIDFSNEQLWQLLDVFSRKNINFDYDIFTSLDPFTFLFQNILGRKLTFSDHSLHDILYNPELLNKPTTNKKIFIGFIEDVPVDWNDSIIVIVNKISKHFIEFLSKYSDVTVYRTFLVPGIIYECHNKLFDKNINKIYGILEETNKLNLLNLQKTNIIPGVIQLIKILNLNFSNTSYNIRCIYNLLINSDADKYFYDREDLVPLHKINAKNIIVWDDKCLIDNEIKYLKQMKYNVTTLNHGMFISNQIIKIKDPYIIIYNKNKLFKDIDLTLTENEFPGKNIYKITNTYIEKIQNGIDDIFIYDDKFLVKKNNTLDAIKSDFDKNNSNKFVFNQFFKDEKINDSWYDKNIVDLSSYNLVGFVINNVPIENNDDKNLLYFKRFNRYYKYTKESEIIQIEKFDFSIIPYLAMYQK